MKKSGIMAVGVALLALAACDKGPEAGANQTAEEVATEMKKISLKPGQWETTQQVIDVKIEGAPEGMPEGIMNSMKGRTNTNKSCITPEQAKNPSADFLTAQKDSKCSYRGFEMAGGSIKGAVTCPAPDGKGQANISIKGDYAEDQYSMDMEMEAAGVGGAQNSEMKMHMQVRTTGKWLGECPAGGADKAEKAG